LDAKFPQRKAMWAEYQIRPLTYADFGSEMKGVKLRSRQDQEAMPHETTVAQE
jgi:hypothetical protein